VGNDFGEYRADLADLRDGATAGGGNFMTANSNFSQQDTSHPVAGGYVQPAQGVTGALVCLTDTAGSAMKSVGTASNVAYMGTAGYRDATVTAQIGGTAAAPTAGTAVATVTPGTAGLWEVSGTIGISGTTVVAADSHNMALNQTATAKIAKIPSPLISTTGAAAVFPFGPVVLNLSAVDTVNVTAVGNATASSVYAAQIICRLVG
jgi:hypothetical protein